MTTTTIADQVATLTQGMGAQLPADVLEAFGSEQSRLDADGVPAGVPSAGAAMPDGDLLDVHGEPTTLDNARAGQPAVVVFYRGAWCPFCNLTLKAYEAELVPELARRGVALVAISPQKPDGSLSMQETNHLTYTVLSDPGNQIAGQLGILSAPSHDAQAAQAKLGLDLSEVNADGTSTIPMPTVVIVDATATIRWIDVHPNYTTRTEAGEVLAALDEVKG